MQLELSSFLPLEKSSMVLLWYVLLTMKLSSFYGTSYRGLLNLNLIVANIVLLYNYVDSMFNYNTIVGFL